MRFSRASEESTQDNVLRLLLGIKNHLEPEIKLFEVDYLNWYPPNDFWSLRSQCHHSNGSNQLPNTGRRRNHVVDTLTPHPTLDRALWPKTNIYKNQVPLGSFVNVVFGTSGVTFSFPWEVAGVKIVVPEKPIGTLDVANHWPMDTLIEPTAICRRSHEMSAFESFNHLRDRESRPPRCLDKGLTPAPP